LSAAFPSLRTPSETRNPIIVATLVAIATAVMGGLLTKLGPWYFSLTQPSWKPPDWAFGPAWTLIFACTAASAVFGWWAARGTGKRATVAALFCVNVVCNSLWSLLFFFLQRPDWALIEVAFLWLSIVVLMCYLWPLSKRATLLLVPYLLWVTFAANLNWAIVEMNAPFVGL
jgi:translocator protein